MHVEDINVGGAEALEGGCEGDVEGFGGVADVVDFVSDVVVNAEVG